MEKKQNVTYFITREISSDTSHSAYLDKHKIRGPEYDYYEKVLIQSRVDLVSNNYSHYLNVVGWIFVEDEWDEGSFNYTLEAIYCLEYKREIQKWSEALARENAKRQKFDFDSTKKDYYRRYGRYLSFF